MKSMKVTLEFESYPPRYTCEGEDISPRIGIGGLEAPYLAMILDDPDAAAGTYVHWVIWNIKASDEVPESISTAERPDELPGAVQGSNSAGTIGYTGPCPPRGSTHRYYLKVYGLESPLDLPPGSTKADLEKALRGKARQYGEAMATYGR